MAFDWKKTLSTVAPMIGTALGGPMGGMAAKMATQALGLGDSENPEQALAEAVASGDPDVLLKLRNADHDFKVEMERLGVDLERIHAGDRSSARELGKTKGLMPQAIISAIFVVGFVGVLYAIFTATVAPELENALMYLLGILSAGLTQILNFWFGSSSGSKQKTDGLLGK
jgi:membrane-bound ClpP family serine protease